VGFFVFSLKGKKMAPKEHKKLLFWLQFAYFAFAAINQGLQAWQNLHLKHYIQHLIH
jgi:hypothetical protein